jgi:rod shape determining protein RodA
MALGTRYSSALNPNEMTWQDKVWQLNWGLIALITAVAAIGFLTLYSAAQGSLHPWALKQMIRFGLGMVGLILVALIDIRFWLRQAYPLYGLALLLLLAVLVRGSIGMGAQRWINLGFIQLQPSEVMKVALVLALARYFHGATIQEVGRPLFLVPPLVMVAVPVALVLKQPDLGTALMLVMSAGALFFMAGVRMWKFALVLVLGLAALPVAWHFLHGYQRQRLIVFLNPGADPLGAGYHILQSKIALGSGGLFGKGYMMGTQSRLDFLPEKQTDFIFTMFGEEWGMVGGLVLLALYVLLVTYGFAIALRCRSHFGRLMALGVTTTFFLYFFINVAMVMGLVPVVGVPLPLISYGGTAMLTLLFGFGLIMNAYVHRDVQIGRRGANEE